MDGYIYTSGKHRIGCSQAASHTLAGDSVKNDNVRGIQSIAQANRIHDCLLNATISKAKHCMNVRCNGPVVSYYVHSHAFYYPWTISTGGAFPMSRINAIPAQIKSIGCISSDLVSGVHLIWRSCCSLSNIPPHLCGGSKSMARRTNCIF